MRLRRWAKTVLRFVPRYSRPLRGSDTEKLIVLGWVATPSWFMSFTKFG